jgi:CheY-like chemotaxis protein
MRILAADDHPTNRRVIELMLGSETNSLTLVEDGLAAVQCWEQSTFDIILMDMQMPVMDGLEAVRHIRARELHTGRQRTPIAILSAATMPENIRDAALAGADLHLAKPITPLQLLAGLNRTMLLSHAVACTKMDSKHCM